MGKAIFQQIKTAVIRAVRSGDAEINTCGTTISIQHVLGDEYRVILPDGGEIMRFDRVGTEIILT